VATKRVDRFDLGPESFAYVGDEKDTSTWKMPIHFPGDNEKTINHIKNAFFHFTITKIPDGERASVWRILAGCAKAHGIPVGAQPASAAPGTAHPETAKRLDVEDLKLKQARAVGLLAAEKLLKRMGYA
jgi:hypothetical protein